MTTRIVLIGAGGYAREVAALLADINGYEPRRYEVEAFLIDEGYALDDATFVAPVIRNIAAYDKWADVEALCCVGSPLDRRTLVTRLAHKPIKWATVIHPVHSWLATGSTIGEGSIVHRYAGCTTDVRIGRHVHLNAVSGVGHDSRVGDFVTVSSFANVTGRCVVEDDVFVGSHACVLPNLTLGRGAKIGAGSIVVRSVPAGATVFGNPAKRVDA